MSHWQPIDWMFLGYSVMWGALVLYMVNLQRRQAALQRELAALEAELGDEAAPAAADPADPDRASPLSPAGGGSRASR